MHAFSYCAGHGIEPRDISISRCFDIRRDCLGSMSRKIFPQICSLGTGSDKRFIGHVSRAILGSGNLATNLGMAFQMYSCLHYIRNFNNWKQHTMGGNYFEFRTGRRSDRFYTRTTLGLRTRVRRKCCRGYEYKAGKTNWINEYFNRVLRHAVVAAQHDQKDEYRSVGLMLRMY